VVAPGDNIVSNVSRTAWLARKYPQLVTVSEERGSFLRLSGTSMATGVATGVVALVLEAQRFGGLSRAGFSTTGSLSGSFEQWITLYRQAPRISANMVKALLQYSALPVADADGPYDALTQGAGEVNAEGAVRLAFAVDLTAPVGTRWMADFGQPSSTIDGQSLSWSQTVYWGGREVVGPSLAVSELAWQGHVVWGTSTFWSAFEDLEHIVWGTTIDWSFMGDEHIVWGTGLPFSYSFLSDEHIVWGTNLFWDEHIVWGTRLIGLFYDEHIVWGSTAQDNSAWGSLLDLEHIVWGTNQVAAADLK
jgi:hypothetical protein